MDGPEIGRAFNSLVGHAVAQWYKGPAAVQFGLKLVFISIPLRFLLGRKCFI